MSVAQTPEQLGICSWSIHPKDPAELIERLRQLGLKRLQLALGPMVHEAGTWGDVQTPLRDAGITIVSGMFGTIGEDYSSLESIRRTGGLVPDEHWQANWQNIQKYLEAAARLELPMVSFHAGFIPDDPASATYGKLQERIGQVADLFASENIDLIFETGQETADTLRGFMERLDRPNVGVNFDPANMILYGKGDPIDALGKLAPRVRQVHVKDARQAENPGTWGTEVPIGEGDVEWDAFVRTLAEADFQDSYIIEREAGADRVGDVRKAIARMKSAMEQLA